MHSVSISRSSSSRATTAAGTRPPRVIATMPFHGPLLAGRQASALAWRCSSSHDTGKALGLVVGVTGGGLVWGDSDGAGDGARATAAGLGGAASGAGGGGDGDA